MGTIVIPLCKDCRFCRPGKIYKCGHELSIVDDPVLGGKRLKTCLDMRTAAFAIVCGPEGNRFKPRESL